MSPWLAPARALGLLFLAQLVIWFFLFPEEPSIPGAAPKFWSGAAVAKYLMLSVTLLSAAWLGAVAGRSSGGQELPVDPPGRSLQSASVTALALGLLGELIYARELIFDPAQLLIAFQYASVADLGMTARAERVIGLSSLSNLLPIPLAIHGQLLFAADPGLRRRARRVVGIALGVIVLHGLLLAGRMTVVNAVMILAAAWLARPAGQRRQARRRRGVALAAAVALLLWGGETLRSGITFAVPQGVSPLSSEAQAHVAERLAQGYFGADLNNAFVLFECEPEMQVVGSTPFRFLLSNPLLPENCPIWQSAYGTINITGIAWWDLGWLAFPALAVGGALLGVLYGLTSTIRSQAVRLLFLIAVPGYAGLLRVNWYASTAFLIPLGYLAVVALLTAALRGASVRHMPAEAGQP
jgi:hypothetical protein